MIWEEKPLCPSSPCWLVLLQGQSWLISWGAPRGDSPLVLFLSHFPPMLMQGQLERAAEGRTTRWFWGQVWGLVRPGVTHPCSRTAGSGSPVGTAVAIPMAQHSTPLHPKSSIWAKSGWMTHPGSFSSRRDCARQELPTHQPAPRRSRGACCPSVSQQNPAPGHAVTQLSLGSLQIPQRSEFSISFYHEKQQQQARASPSAGHGVDCKKLLALRRGSNLNGAEQPQGSLALLVVKLEELQEIWGREELVGELAGLEEGSWSRRTWPAVPKHCWCCGGGTQDHPPALSSEPLLPGPAPGVRPFPSRKLHLPDEASGGQMWVWQPNPRNGPR